MTRVDDLVKNKRERKSSRFKELITIFMDNVLAKTQVDSFSQVFIRFDYIFDIFVPS